MESFVFIIIAIAVIGVVAKAFAGVAEWSHNNAQPVLTKPALMSNVSSEWSHNNAQPVLTEPAKIISKRCETRKRTHHHGGIHDRHHLHHHHHTTTSTDYFVIFETDSGKRLKFEVSEDEYDLALENDYGALTYQGTRFHGFHRNSLSHP